MSLSIRKQIDSGKARFLSTLFVSTIVMAIVFVLTNSIMSRGLREAKNKYVESCSIILDGFTNSLYYYLKNYGTSIDSIYDEELFKRGNHEEIKAWVKHNRPPSS